MQSSEFNQFVLCQLISIKTSRLFFSWNLLKNSCSTMWLFVWLLNIILVKIVHLYGFTCHVSKKSNLSYCLSMWNMNLIMTFLDFDNFKWFLQVMPKQPGFEKRRDLYMLYHYLNHYNLFGSGYRSSAMSIIDDYLAYLKA